MYILYIEGRKEEGKEGNNNLARVHDMNSRKICEMDGEMQRSIHYSLRYTLPNYHLFTSGHLNLLQHRTFFYASQYHKLSMCLCPTCHSLAY